MDRKYRIIESLSVADEATDVVVYGIELVEKGENISLVRRVQDISTDKGLVGLLVNELTEKDVSASCLLPAIENYITGYLSACR